MSTFQPFTARSIEKHLRRTRELWDAADPEDRTGMINPDEPVVLSVPNPDYDEEYDEESEEYFHFHVMSVGGGGDVDEDGVECGHDGFALSGMNIDESQFLFNGRRR